MAKCKICISIFIKCQEDYD